jgi:hypothetical protein
VGLPHENLEVGVAADISFSLLPHGRFNIFPKRIDKLCMILHRYISVVTQEVEIESYYARTARVIRGLDSADIFVNSD